MYISISTSVCRVRRIDFQFVSRTLVGHRVLPTNNGIPPTYKLLLLLLRNRKKYDRIILYML